MNKNLTTRIRESGDRYLVEYLIHGEWKKYCSCKQLQTAVDMEVVCRNNNCEYPVLRTYRSGVTRFRIVRDLEYFADDVDRCKILFSRFLGRWYSLGSYIGLDVAEEVVSKFASGQRRLPKYGVEGWFKKAYDTIESTVLCLRFPFLYPRNRFSGLHHTNWKLINRMKDLNTEAFECTNHVDFHNGMSEKELYDIKHPKYRVVNFGKAIRYYLLKALWYVDRFLHCIPTSTELDAMPSGWRKAFGIEICIKIKKALKKAGYLRKYRIMQIKEKWGELCWYDAGAPKEVFDITRNYETVSINTCIECGRPAKYISTGWVEPYCEHCVPKTVIDSGRYRLVDGSSGWIDINSTDDTAIDTETIREPDNRTR